jgi:Tfp pilus assembly protein FimT
MFTLILLALVYAIAVPSVMNARVSASVHNAKYSVVSSVQLARATAIRYGRPAVLRLDASEDRVWIEVDTTVAGAGVMDTLGSIHLADEFNVELKSNRTGFCYNGRGIATTGTACPNAGGWIIVAKIGKADTIVISTVGRVLE